MEVGYSCENGVQLVGLDVGREETGTLKESFLYAGVFGYEGKALIVLGIKKSSVDFTQVEAYVVSSFKVAAGKAVLFIPVEVVCCGVEVG